MTEQLYKQQQSQGKPRIVVLGAGSIGCYLGGCLIDADVKVTLIGREKLAQQLMLNGLKVTDWQGIKRNYAINDFTFSTSNECLAAADYVFVTVKSGDTTAAAKILAEHVNPNAIIVSFQNGISNSDELQRYLPQQTILKGMVPFNVVNHGNGHFHCATNGDLAIEDKKGLACQLTTWFQAVGVPTKMYNDLEAVQWGKLLLNLNNAINALSGVSLVDEIFNRQYRKVLALSMKEGLQVLKAAKIKPAKASAISPALLPLLFSLPDWLFERIAGATFKADPSARSSMSEDLQLGRKTEVDFINGEVVKLAETVGVATPVNRAIIKLIKQAEKNGKGSPKLSASEMLHCVLN